MEVKLPGLSYRARIQTGIYPTPEGKLLSRKQDVSLDQSQLSGQPAGTKTSFPPPDTEQGSEVIKTYLWSSCYKAGIVMQKRGKKETQVVYCIPGEVTHIKMKRKTPEAGEQSQKRRATGQPHQFLCLVMEPEPLQPPPHWCLCAWLRLPQYLSLRSRST